ncbi:MAG: hypothetical protein GC191_04145 [Azospirillum sp.]|nr:hypothetical protein [Azospirillum sp.]
MILKSLTIYMLAIAISLLVALVIRGIVLVLARNEEKRAKLAPQAPAKDQPAAKAGPNADDIVAIAAAIQAVFGSRRILKIESHGAPGHWMLEGRHTHHSSHADRRPSRH